jgi:hypothetical protein
MMNFLYQTALLVFLTTFLIFPVYSFAAVFQNGSFETLAFAYVADNACCGVQLDTLTAAAGDQKLSAWTIKTSGTITGGGASYTGSIELLKVVGGAPIASPKDGIYFVELAGNSGRTNISQVFDTIPGKNYQLKFYLWRNVNTGSLGDEDIKYYVCQTSSCATIYSTATYRPLTNSWNLYTVNFTPTTASSYVSFENLTNSFNGAYIDSISITEMPNLNFFQNMYVYDIGNENLKAVPGNDVINDWGFTNTAGVPDAGTVVLVLSVPTHLAFQVGSLTFVDGEVPGIPTGDPSTSQDSSVGNSSLSIGTVTYSSTGTTGPWTYIPTGAYDANVRAIKVTPSGTMNHGNSGAVGFRLYYRGRIS